MFIFAFMFRVVTQFQQLDLLLLCSYFVYISIYLCNCLSIIRSESLFTHPKIVCLAICWLGCPPTDLSICLSIRLSDSWSSSSLKRSARPFYLMVDVCLLSYGWFSVYVFVCLPVRLFVSVFHFSPYLTFASEDLWITFFGVLGLSYI